MIKKCAREISFEDFCKELSSQNINELTNMNISYSRAYNIFKEILNESRFEENDDIGTMDSIIKNIILDYTEEVLAEEYSKYETNWDDQ